jgi:hypothetical protein
MNGCELCLMSENLCLIENFQKFTLEKSDQSLLDKKSMHTIETNLHQLFSLNLHFQTSFLPDLELLDHLLNKRNLCLKHQKLLSNLLVRLVEVLVFCKNPKSHLLDARNDKNYPEGGETFADGLLRTGHLRM